MEEHDSPLDTSPSKSSDQSIGDKVEIKTTVTQANVTITEITHEITQSKDDSAEDNVIPTGKGTTGKRKAGLVHQSKATAMALRFWWVPVIQIVLGIIGIVMAIRTDQKLLTLPGLEEWLNSAVTPRLETFSGLTGAVFNWSKLTPPAIQTVEQGLLLAILLMVVAVWPRKMLPPIIRRKVGGKPPVVKFIPRPSRLNRVSGGLLLASVPFYAIGLMIWSQDTFWHPASNVAAILYGIGLLLAIAAIIVIWRGEQPKEKPPKDWEYWMRLGLDRAILAGIIGVAVYFRFHDLSKIPWGVWYDEGDQAIEGRMIAQGLAYSPVGLHFHYNPALYYDLLAIGFKFLGVGVLSARTVTALIGVAAVPFTYLLGRQAFGRWVGAFAALFLAASRWETDFSRFTMSNITAPLFCALALWLVVRALESGRWSDYMWAGLAFGVGLHSYTPYRLFMFVVPVVVIWRFLWNPTAIRRNVTGLVFFAALTIIGVGPLLPYARLNWNDFNYRIQQTSILGNLGQSPGACPYADPTTGKVEMPQIQQCVKESAIKQLLMFNYIGDGQGRHNLPNAPMLDILSAALLVLGLGIVIFRLRNWRFLMLLAWFAISLSGGIFSVLFEAPQGARTLPITPDLALLGALPIGLLIQRVDELGDILRRVKWNWAERLVSPAAIGWARQMMRPLAIGLSVLAPLLSLWYVAPPVVKANYDSYFVQQAHDFDSWRSYDADATLVAREILRLGPDYTFQVDHRDWGRTPVFDFLLSKQLEDQVTAYDPQTVLPLNTWGAKGVAVFIPVDDGQSLFAQAKRFYPNAEYHDLGPTMATTGFDGNATEHEVIISADVAAGIHGLHASYWSGGAPTGAPVKTDHVAGLGNLDLSANPPLPGSFYAQWTGVLYVHPWGAYMLNLHANGDLTVYLDGQAVARSDGNNSAIMTLAEGNHSLVVKGTISSVSLPIQMQWAQQGGNPAPIPNDNFFAPPVAATGLLGTYYNGPAIGGSPGLKRIDPNVYLYFDVPPDGVADHFSIDWTGVVSAPVSGNYQFGLQSIDDAQLKIDGQQIVDSTNQPNNMVNGQITLTAGWHDIEITYHAKTNYVHCYLYWAPPGGVQDVIPSTALLPSKNME